MFGFRQFINNQGVDNKIIDTYLNNPKMRISEIAQAFGKSKTEIYRILQNNHISPNRLMKNHLKVTNLYHLGWNIQEIAKFTGYTSRNVRYILNNISEEKNDH